jgi:hypothetical protein
MEDTMNWCWLDIHKWAKWSAPKQMTGRQRTTHYGVPISDWEKVRWDEQNRTCELCGKYEARKVE